MISNLLKLLLFTLVAFTGFVGMSIGVYAHSRQHQGNAGGFQPLETREKIEPSATPQSTVFREQGTVKDQLQLQLYAVRGQIKEAEQIYGSNHAKIRTLERRANLLEAQVRAEAGKVATSRLKLSAEQLKLKQKVDRAEKNSLRAASFLLNADLKDEQARSNERLKLQNVVQEAFDLRMQLQTAQLDDAEAKLKTSRQRLVRRQSLAKQIVERRVNELINNDETKWSEQPLDVAKSVSPQPKLDPIPLGLLGSTKESAAIAEIKRLANACKFYKLNIGAFPTKLQDFSQLPNGLSQAQWGGPYDLNPPISNDPWDQPYKYTPSHEANTVLIQSAGPDGQFGSDDDLSNAQAIAERGRARPVVSVSPRLPTKASSPPQLVDPMHRVRAGDVLSVFVPVLFDDMKLDKTSSGYPIHVKSNGMISLPEIGRLKVAGKTALEIENELIKKYVDEPLDDGEPLFKDEARDMISVVVQQVYKPAAVAKPALRSLSSKSGVDDGFNQDAEAKAIAGNPELQRIIAMEEAQRVAESFLELYFSGDVEQAKKLTDNSRPIRILQEAIDPGETSAPKVTGYHRKGSSVSFDTTAVRLKALPPRKGWPQSCLYVQTKKNDSGAWRVWNVEVKRLLRGYSGVSESNKTGADPGQRSHADAERRIPPTKSQLEKLIQDHEALVFADDPDRLHRNMADLIKKIEAGKTMLSTLTSDFARSEAALEGGRDSCMEHIWLLESAGKIAYGSFEAEDKSEQIAKEKSMVKDLESRRGHLRLQLNLGGNDEKIQALDSAIKERQAKIEQLRSEGVKVIGIPPERIVRRYIVGLKQQISDARRVLASDLVRYSKLHEKAVELAGANEWAAGEDLVALIERAEVERVAQGFLNLVFSGDIDTANRVTKNPRAIKDMQETFYPMISVTSAPVITRWSVDGDRAQATTENVKVKANHEDMPGEMIQLVVRLQKVEAKGWQVTQVAFTGGEIVDEGEVESKVEVPPSSLDGSEADTNPLAPAEPK